MFLIVEACDFVRFPAGGQLTMARHLMRAFGAEAALAGFATDDSTPVGEWIERDFDGTRHPFFAFGRRPFDAKRPLVPGRLQAYAQLRRYRDAILSIGRVPLFTQSPEALLAGSGWPVPSICHRLSGVANSLEISRYRAARPLAPLYSLALFSALRRADVILAAADHPSIDELTGGSGGLLPRGRVIHFPTRVDTDLFTSGDKRAARIRLGVPEDAPLFVATGRVGRLKGWPLLLDAFRLVLRRMPEARLRFVGDGEDGGRLRTAARGLEGSVEMTGFLPPERVALWLQAADAYVSGSCREGWPVSMLEALACGKAVVTTAVSGARDMVREGENGFVVSREPVAFAAAMEEALRLDAGAVSVGIAGRYGRAGLREDLVAVWPGMRAEKSFHHRGAEDTEVAQRTIAGFGRG